MISVLGVPSDEHSSFLRGAAGAPDAIRGALQSASSNLFTEAGLDLGTRADWQDVGDVGWTRGEGHHEAIERAVGVELSQGHRPLVLGGDHAITYPILRAFGRHGSDPPTVLHLDAHPDLYDLFDGDPHSHASPFARVMEEGLASRLVQVGIRTMNPHQRAQAERFDVEVIEMRSLEQVRELRLEGPLFLSFDMDVLDPAFAPGVSHHEPGGMSTRQALEIIQGLDVPVVGADLVELNPLRDPTGVTAMTAAKLLKEILGKMLEG